MRVGIKPSVLPSTVSDEVIGNYEIIFILAFPS